MQSPTNIPSIFEGKLPSRSAVLATLVLTLGCNPNQAEDKMADETTDQAGNESEGSFDALPDCERNPNEPGLYLNFDKGLDILKEGDSLPVIEVDGVEVLTDNGFPPKIDPCMTEDDVVQYAIPYKDNNLTADDAGSVGLDLAVYGYSLAHSLNNGGDELVTGYHSLPADKSTHWDVFVPEEPLREEE